MAVVASNAHFALHLQLVCGYTVIFPFSKTVYFRLIVILFIVYFVFVLVDDSYFAHLDHTGRRTDIQHRPEQFLGSYEFVATKPYCKVRFFEICMFSEFRIAEILNFLCYFYIQNHFQNGLKPKEPAFIFMLDVSYSAVHCGLVSIFCRNIRNLLNNLPKFVSFM